MRANKVTIFRNATERIDLRVDGDALPAGSVVQGLLTWTPQGRQELLAPGFLNATQRLEWVACLAEARQMLDGVEDPDPIGVLQEAFALLEDADALLEAGLAWEEFPRWLLHVGEGAAIARAQQVTERIDGWLPPPIVVVADMLRAKARELSLI